MITDETFLTTRRYLLILTSSLFILNVTDSKISKVNIFSNAIDISDAQFPFNSFNSLILILCFYFLIRFINLLERENIELSSKDEHLALRLMTINREIEQNVFMRILFQFFIVIILTCKFLFNHKTLYYLFPIVFYFITIIITPSEVDNRHTVFFLLFISSLLVGQSKIIVELFLSVHADYLKIETKNAKNNSIAIKSLIKNYKNEDIKKWNKRYNSLKSKRQNRKIK